MIFKSEFNKYSSNFNQFFYGIIENERQKKYRNCPSMFDDVGPMFDDVRHSFDNIRRGFAEFRKCSTIFEFLESILKKF